VGNERHHDVARSFHLPQEEAKVPGVSGVHTGADGCFNPDRDLPGCWRAEG
jgi:hypothetical protein